MRKNIDGKWLLEGIYRIVSDNEVEEQITAFCINKNDMGYMVEVDEGEEYKRYMFYEDENRTINEKVLRPIEVSMEVGKITFTVWGYFLIFKQIN